MSPGLFSSRSYRSGHCNLQKKGNLDQTTREKGIRCNILLYLTANLQDNILGGLGTDSTGKRRLRGFIG